MKKIKKVNLRYIFLALGVASLIAVPIVNADSLQDQINNLENKNAQSQNSLSQLISQATSYQNAITTLQTQINAIQGAINASEKSIGDLQAKIDQAQVQLNYQKQTLASDVRAIYVSGSTNTVEMLASSKNLSVFVDQETYQKAVEGKIQTTLNKIAALQNQLSTQKEQVQQTLSVQQQQNAQLASAQAQQQQLMGYNQAQQAQFNSQIQSNQKQITVLQQEQAAINEAGSTALTPPSGGGTGGNCGTPNYPIGGTYYYTGDPANAPNGGYPMNWCNDSQDSVVTLGGFPNRECTSFAYWYFTSVLGHTDFSVTGNANQWWYLSNRPVDQTPAAGSIAVDPKGEYGHVMIVVASPGESYGGSVVPAGRIDTISMNDDWYGHFFIMQRPYSGFYFIH